MSLSLKLNIKINSCDIYIMIGCLYYLQDVIYPAGFINRVIQLVMILWALLVSIRYIVNFKYAPKLINAVSLLVFMYMIYGLGYMLFNSETVITETTVQSVGSYYYLQNALNSLLPYYLLYSFAEQGKLTVGRIRGYCFIFFIVFVLIYFKLHKQMLLEAVLRGSEQKEFTNNTGYYFIMLIPYMFFIRNQLFRYVLLIGLMIFTVMCMKRGAILIGAMSFVWFLIANFRQSKSMKKKTVILLLSVGVVCSAIGYISYKQESSKYFRSRIEQTQKGDASGRNMIYPKIWKAIVYDESVTHLLVGRGANSTVDIAGNYAHQDWLELACNNGLIGIILALFFYITIFCTAIFNRRIIPSEYYVVLLMFGFILFTKTMFSMSLASMKIWEIIPITYILFAIRDSKMNLVTDTLYDENNNNL